MITPAVLCMGRIYCDLVFSDLQQPPQPGAEIYAQGVSLHSGGGAAITAHTLGRLGCHVELCASIPAPPFDQIIRTDLEPKVNLQHCAKQAGDDPQITVVLTGEGDRSFITHRAGAALPDNYHDCIKQSAAAGRVKHLHIAELATLLEYPDLISLARAAEWTISLDCAWDEDALQSANALGLIEQVDLFLPNEAEFSELSRRGLTGHLTTVVVVKKGAQGAQLISKNELIEVPAETNLTCIDTTGAGDAFNAGFIDAWLQHAPLPQCLESGNRCGGVSIGHFGGIFR